MAWADQALPAAAETTAGTLAGTADPYAILAPYYDDLLGHFRDRFEAVRDRVLADAFPAPAAAAGAPNPSRVYADLACGTGTSCLQMAFRGWQSHGVDNATAMLAAAREKLSRVQAAPATILAWLASADHRRLRKLTPAQAQATLRPLTLQFHQASLTNFRLPEPADFMTCLFDSLNHLPTTADLLPALTAVRANLAPGGRFLCDLNAPRAIREVWPTMKPEIHENLEQGYVAIVRGGAYDSARHQASLQWTWFLRDDSALDHAQPDAMPASSATTGAAAAAAPHANQPGTHPAARWQRIAETYREVAWPRADIRRTFKKAGLRIRWIKDAGALHHGFDPGWRWFVLAERA